MTQVFIRRTTAALLIIAGVLAIVCVGLLVLLVAPKWKQGNETNADGTTGGGPKDTTTSPEQLELKYPWEKQYRIPEVTIPVHYDLYLHPDLDSGKYSGKVDTLIKVMEEIDFLVTHVKYLNISQTKLINKSNNQEVDVRDAFEYKRNEFWVVRPNKVLTPGEYVLSLNFDGTLDGKIVGFYKSVYKTKSGVKRTIATSKFQPTYARQAFPCFDEPSFKSTFTVTLVRPSQDYIALSNMPQQSEKVNTPRAGLTEVMFEKSVPMVTYLACFIVCDFESIQTLTQDNKKFTVYATKDQLSRAEYAKDIGVHILNYFENYFEVKYPLPKQDMIAIPDFVSGAMEHWGLITYREVNLLYDAASSSSYNKLRVASVISHELAHMWFGNLVTLKWWDDLWLNEGFASYIEYKGVASYEKDWDMESQFLTSDLHYVMNLDSQVSSHPIVQVVNHPDEITEIFDAISYSKGASVLRMLENFMGSEDFRKGISNFLSKYKYKNAITEDLWTELSSISKNKLDISSIMGTWTRQMGYPVINVKRSGDNKLRITQERFLSDPNAKSKDDSAYGYKWDIPISYWTDLGGENMFWLRRNMDSAEININPTASWIKFNKGQYGYYRVNYDEQSWRDLVRQLNTNHEVLGPADRANLLNDGFMLASSGRLPYNTAFELTSYLGKERHFVPWRTVVHEFSEFKDRLRKTKVFPLLREYIVNLAKSHTKRLGWEDTGDNLERRNRVDLLSLACASGDPDCLTEAHTRFKSWINDPSFRIPPNLRSVVYTYGMKKAGFDDWEVVLSRYTSELNAQEKSKLLSGLCSIEKDWVLHRLLDIAKNETIIRSQDYFSALIKTARNPAGTQIVWDFIKNNWEYLVDRFTLNDRYLGRAVKYVVTEFTSEYELEDVNMFFAKYPEAGSGKRAREQGLEELQTRINWVKLHEKTIHKWLETHQVN